MLRDCETQSLPSKLIKHHYTLFLNIAAAISAACLVYALLLKLSEVCFGISSFHEAGYICSMLFIIPGFPFITSGIDLAKLDLRSGLVRLTYAIIIVLVATMFAKIRPMGRAAMIIIAAANHETDSFRDIMPRL